MCGKCKGWTGLLLLIFGILFLLADLNVWNFWGISWYTVLFVIAGIAMVSCGCCGECCEAPAKKKK